MNKADNTGNIRGASLRTRILVRFVVLFIFVMAATMLVLRDGLPFSRFPGIYESFRSEAFDHFSTIADIKKERMMRWLEERRDDAAVLARNPELVQKVERISSFLREHAGGTMPGKNAEVWKRLLSQDFHQRLCLHLEHVKNTYGVYEEIQVLEPSTGQVLASSDTSELGDEAILPRYLSEHLYSGGDEHIEVLKDIIHENFSIHLFRDIRIGGTGFPGVKRATGGRHALLLMHIHTEDIVRPLLYGSLGGTGETVLFTRELRIITSLKHPLPGGARAVPLQYRLDTAPARYAAGGEEGMLATVDYRGVPVLAAFRNIRLNAETSWGMVVKQDEAEIFAPYRRMLVFFAIIAALGSILIVLLSSFIANGLTKPLQILSNAVRRVETGKLDVRVPGSPPGELGVLTRGFNSMIGEIESWHKELGKKVDERTRDLELTNRELTKEIAVRKQAEKDKEILMQEIHHRVKNNMQIISSLHKLQAVYIDAPEVKRIFAETQNRIRAMAQVHEQLYRSPNLADVNLSEYFQQLVHNLVSSSQTAPRNIRVEVKADGAVMGLDSLIPCGLIVNELVTNSIKYAFDPPKEAPPELHVLVENPGGAGNRFMVTVSDNGRGLPPDLDISQTETLGFQLVSSLVNQLQGTISIKSNEGAVFKIDFTDKKK